MTTLQFEKIEATGNDFVIYSNTAEPDKAQIKHLCDRHLGIGADGMIVLQPEAGRHAFRFNYFNSDGSRGEMCVNGCRAAVLFASRRGWIAQGKPFTFLADDGAHEGHIEGDTIRVEVHINSMPRAIALDVSGELTEGYAINTGVPHVVFFSDDLNKSDFIEWARKIRNDRQHFPKGTNVNLLKRVAGDTIKIRTYERGVEAETLSCGTGMCASAYVFAARSEMPRNGINVISAGGRVNIRKKDKSLYITGPARFVFRGEIELP